MRVSLFSSELDAQAEAAEVSWEDLREILAKPRIGSKSGPAWSPATFREGRRKKNLVESICCAVFDLDKLSPEQFVSTVERVVATPFAAIVHTTHSHTEAKPSARLVLALDRPVLPGEWDRVRSGLIKMYDLTADANAADASRLFYLPAIAAEGAPFEYLDHDGEGVPVEEILKVEGAELAAAFIPPPLASPVINADGSIEIAKVRDALASTGKPDSRALMKLLLAGQPIAKEGERDSTLYRAVGVAVFAAPSGTPLEIFEEIFRPSLNVMPGPPPERGTWHDNAREKILRSMESKAQADALKAAQVAALNMTLARDGAHTRRPEAGSAEAAKAEDAPTDAPLAPYTPAEIMEFAASQGCGSIEEFKRRWVIQHGSSYYLFSEGRYLAPIPGTSLRNSIFRDLARSGLDMYLNGGIRKNEREIVDECSSVARFVIASLALQNSYYDPGNQTFHEAVTPLRPLPAVFDSEIDTWLRLLGGVHAEKLLDWVAAVTRLDRQACAVYLCADPGVGKNLFASGLARLWHTGGPSELAGVLGGFNEGLARCPILFADEELPNVDGMTAKLRRMLGESSRTLNRKFLPTVTLDGSIRLIIAGNNDRLLDTGEDLDQADREAVAARFLYIESPKVAADYLNLIGGPPHINAWIQDDKIAKHALWLRNNRKLYEAGRFIVQGDMSEFHDHLAVSSGLAALVSELLVRYLSDPKTLEQTNPQILEGEGQLWVNPEGLSRENVWNARLPVTIKTPTASKISQTLRSLAVNKKQIPITAADGSIQHYFSIQIGLLLAWAKRNGVGDAGTIEARLSKPNLKMRLQT